LNRLRQFWRYANKVFDLTRSLRSVRAQRWDPDIPTPVITLTLFMGGLLRVGSFLQLEKHTARVGWQRLVRWAKPISDDTLARATERYELADLRATLVSVNQTLKANKAFDRAKISGLLVVSIDGNEQFSSRCRCCPECCQRTVTIKNRSGQLEEVTEYYHRQVYAQIHGPVFSVILDLEPVRPGEDEAKAALRLLGRLRRSYGCRFFDVVSVDAWYATSPFLRAVCRLGWGVVTVLKQERYEIFQEATALSARQSPQTWGWEQRQIKAWDVKQLPFGEAGLVRVVLAEESWQQNRYAGGRKITLEEQRQWRWIADSSLDGYSAQTIWQIGHQRWGIENHAFNELTRHYHLTHCPHHHPLGIIAWLLLLALSFNLFELFVRLNVKACRHGRTTLQEIAQQLDRALELPDQLEALWSG
jgi:hypothetical protein